MGKFWAQTAFRSLQFDILAGVWSLAFRVGLNSFHVALYPCRGSHSDRKISCSTVIDAERVSHLADVRQSWCEIPRLTLLAVTVRLPAEVL